MICRVCNYVLLFNLFHWLKADNVHLLRTLKLPVARLVSFLESFIYIRVDLCLQKILVPTSGPFHLLLRILTCNFGCPANGTLFHHGARTVRIAAEHGLGCTV